MTNATIYEIRRYLEYAATNDKNLQEIILCADFFQFVDNPNQDIFKVLPYKDEKTFEDSLPTLANFQKVLFSWNAIKDSFNNCSKNFKKSYDYPCHDLNGKFSEKHIENLFGKNNAKFFKIFNFWKTKINFSEVALQNSALEDFQKIVEFCAEKKLKLYVCILPLYPVQYENFNDCQNVYEEWKIRLAEIFPIYDFTYFGKDLMQRQNFWDSSHVKSNIGDKILAQTHELYNDINNALARYNVSRAITHGFNIALVGETNVGKSSVFNKLVGANRAIVSDIAGTTRDVISAQIDIDGYLVNLSDTAGLRQTDDQIEQMGIDRTKCELENADLVLHLFANDTDIKPDSKTIIVINKCDTFATRNNSNAIYTSAKNDTGIDKLLNAIRAKMHSALDTRDNTLVVNARTYKLLNDTKTELGHAIEKFDGNYDILAEHVRAAADSIGKILGVITANDVMDATFSQLCLGK